MVYLVADIWLYLSTLVRRKRGEMVADRRGGRVQRKPSANAASGAELPLAPSEPTPERRSARKRAKLESQPEIVLDGAGDAAADPSSQQEGLRENGAPATSSQVQEGGAVNGETLPAANGEAVSLGKAPGAKSKKELDAGNGEYVQLLGSKELEVGDDSKWVPIWPQLESRSPGLLALLSEFRSELEELAKANMGEMKFPLTPFTNASYLKHLELAFVLRAERTEIYRALKTAVARGAPTGDPGALPEARYISAKGFFMLLKGQSTFQGWFCKGVRLYLGSS